MALAIDRSRIVKPIDAWWTVLVVDPVAVRLVPVLARRPAITPTRLTWLAHAIGVVAVVAFGLDVPVAGAVLFELRFLADCLDGKLARATGTTSVFGRELDVSGDLLFVSANFAALGLVRVADDRTGALLVVTLVGAYVLSMHLHDGRQRLLREAGVAPPVDALVSGGIGAAFARRRMWPMPTSVDVEHLVLFVAPVVAALGADVVAPVFVVGAAYYALQGARYAAGMLRVAARMDRDAAAAAQPGSASSERI